MVLIFFNLVMSSTDGANQSCITWKRKKNLCEFEGGRNVYGSLMSGHIYISYFENKYNNKKMTLCSLDCNFQFHISKLTT